MKTIRKCILMPIRTVAYRCHLSRAYYWSEHQLAALQAVHLLPLWYYRGLYRVCMWSIRFPALRRLADRAIHTIPYGLRFAMER